MATTADPPVAPPAPPAPTPPPTPPPAPTGAFLEGDPDHQMRQMIANRGKKKAEPEAKKVEEPPKPVEPQDKKLSSNLGGLIAEALKFRPKNDEKATEPAKAEDKKPDPPKETPKTVVSKRKTEPAPPDPMRIASEAAAAAVREAVGAMSPRGGAEKAEKTAAETQVDQLPEDFRHDYEVAKHLSATNPKYKGAEQEILNEFARTEEYAQHWEDQNPGKPYNPKDAEHNEFYDAQVKPWSEHEFRAAERAVEDAPIAARHSAELDAKLKKLEEQNARHELSQIVGQTVNVVAIALARAVDETAHDVILKQGYSKLEESDPLTAEELVRTLNVLSPRIETAIQLDDPKGRIPFDPKNNAQHAQWLKFLFKKEQEFSGQRDTEGRLFATRNEYAKMPDAQREQRFYLTADHLVSEMLAEAAEEAKASIEQEKERMKKMAVRLGYVPAENKNGEPNKSVASTGPKPKAPETPSTEPAKPMSPSVGGGAKIDTQGDQKKTQHQSLLEATGNILFGR